FGVMAGTHFPISTFSSGAPKFVGGRASFDVCTDELGMLPGDAKRAWGDTGPGIFPTMVVCVSQPANTSISATNIPRQPPDRGRPISPWNGA
ncbi:MAG: hypothetical protein VX223_18510, partial [Myxococcota bacterium]|nr:hypothetical protein [Myxococcota bacterium]